MFKKSPNPKENKRTYQDSRIFPKNSIESITLEDNKWIIKYKGNKPTTNTIDIPEFKEVKEILRLSGRDTIDYSELNTFIWKH